MNPLYLQMGIFLVVMVVFYALLIIPERKRRKKYQSMLDELKVNDEIMTRGGIYGKITKIKDDHIILESGPDKVRLKMAKESISTKIDKDNQ